MKRFGVALSCASVAVDGPDLMRESMTYETREEASTAAAATQRVSGGVVAQVAEHVDGEWRVGSQSVLSWSRSFSAPLHERPPP